MCVTLMSAQSTHFWKILIRGEQIHRKLN